MLDQPALCDFVGHGHVEGDEDHRLHPVKVARHLEAPFELVEEVGDGDLVVRVGDGVLGCAFEELFAFRFDAHLELVLHLVRRLLGHLGEALVKPAALLSEVLAELGHRADFADPDVERAL